MDNYLDLCDEIDFGDEERIATAQYQGHGFWSPYLPNVSTFNFDCPENALALAHEYLQQHPEYEAHNQSTWRDIRNQGLCLREYGPTKVEVKQVGPQKWMILETTEIARGWYTTPDEAMAAADTQHSHKLKV